jgi:hypothetical protein
MGNLLVQREARVTNCMDFGSNLQNLVVLRLVKILRVLWNVNVYNRFHKILQFYLL